MQKLKFFGSGGEYFKIWIVNVLLTMVTLSLYHPWAKVRNQRYFYGNTVLEDRNFEYHATGKQLFVGYLISMGLLIAYLILSNLTPKLSLITIVILVLGIPWIIWRSIMFNMRMSSFSNVRFSFHGTLGGAYANYLALPIFGVLVFYGLPILSFTLFSFFVDSQSLGSFASVLIILLVIIWIVASALAIGLIKKNNTVYYLNGCAYGQGKFQTYVETKAFALIFIKTAVVFLVSVFLLASIVGLIAFSLGLQDGLLSFAANMNNPEATDKIFSKGGVIGLIVMMYLAFIIAGMITFAFYYVRQRQYILSKSKFDNKMAFASTLTVAGFTWISVSNFVLMIITLGLATPWIKVRIVRYIVENTLTNSNIDIDDYVSQQQAQQSSLADQMGDAFDVDVGIGI